MVWYLVRDDHILMNVSGDRLTWRNLSRDQRLSICAEDAYRYVTISGEAELIQDRETAQADITALAERYLGSEQAARMARDVYANQECASILLPLTTVYERGFDAAQAFRVGAQMRKE